MATENPMRIVDSSEAVKWAPSSANSTVNEELEMLLRGHSIHRDESKIAPNRSGSAPPSMEGSFASFGGLVNQHHSSNSNLAALSSSSENFADPSYSTYYHLNTNSNRRLSSPAISRETMQFARNVGSGSMYMPRSSLSTHEEEPEDDRSSKGALDEIAKSGTIMIGQNVLSFTGRHKSLVDLIQEDFPRTPSPVFSHTRNVEESLNHDVQNLSLNSLSLEVSNSSEPDSGIGAGGKIEFSSGVTTIKDASVASAPKASRSDVPQRSFSPKKDERTSKDACFTNDLVSSDTIGSDGSKSVHEAEDDLDKQDLGFDQPSELHVQNTYSQHVAGYHGPGVQVHGTGRGANNNDAGKVPYGHFKITSPEMQPLGVSPPLYNTTAAYMAPGNSYYPSASGLYAPQYSGYALGSSFVPPYMPGYPSNTGFPMHFNANSQSAGIPTAESIPKGSTLQNSNRFYGHHGMTTMPPTYPDPLTLQYFQQALQDPYGIQYSHLTTPGMITGEVHSSASPNYPASVGYTGDQKFHLPPSGTVSIPSPRKMGLPNSSYLSPTGLGFVPQFPASPLGSPILPDSPVGGATPFGRRYDIGFSESSPRKVGGYTRWQGQRGVDSINDHRKHSFLEELKASNTRRIDLSDVVGRIVEFSVDQHGSRYIQQKLENCSIEEKESVFKEVLPHASKLMTDVFGNYVIQKFFEHGTYEQRKELANQLRGQMLPLCLQMYGCRVIQKALEVIELDQKIELVLELDGHVMRCVRDQNGNHVIQKCIECVPTEKIDFIISAFEGQVAILSTHPYGCRVIQRVLEHCSEDLQCRSIVNEILESAYDLAQDQYGNYVTQHVLERGKPSERSQIISKFSGKVVPMSMHKYASNVVEKCLEFGDAAERELLIEEILVQSEDNNDNLLAMMKDQFANYVVQKILDISNDNQKERLLDRIRLHLLALRKYTYGKHIVARFEQLCGEDSGTSEA